MLCACAALSDARQPFYSEPYGGTEASCAATETSFCPARLHPLTGTHSKMVQKIYAKERLSQDGIFVREGLGSESIDSETSLSCEFCCSRGAQHASQSLIQTARTNITEETRPYASTRGELTSSFLLLDHQKRDLQNYIRDVLDRNSSYAGFNLMLFSPAVTSPKGAAGGPAWSYTATLVTNHGGGGTITSRMLSATECRCAGLSNGVDGLGGEPWPKVQHGSRLFLDVLQQSRTPENTEADLVERLFNLLT